MIVSFFLLYYQVSEVRGCYGGGGYYYYYNPPPTTPPPPTKKGAGDMGGFPIPPKLQSKFNEFANDYKRERERENNMIGDHLAPKGERGPGSGWPPSWIGYGMGFAGSDPHPPWAAMPINEGLPDFCMLTPEKGTCAKELERWVFHPFFQKCVEFIYSGCGENQNNFLDKSKCEESCMITPVSGCNPETMQSVEVFDD